MSFYEYLQNKNVVEGPKTYHVFNILHLLVLKTW